MDVGATGIAPTVKGIQQTDQFLKLPNSLSEFGVYLTNFRMRRTRINIYNLYDTLRERVGTLVKTLKAVVEPK